MDKVIPNEHYNVLKDLEIIIYTAEKEYIIRKFTNPLAPYIRMFHHNIVTWLDPWHDQPNVSENILIGMEDCENLPYDNWTDVIVQVTKNPWGMDMDISLSGAQRKQVYYQGKLIMDQNEKRIEWFPLFETSKSTEANP